MTQDDTIRMALEAGFVEYEIDDGTTDAFDGAARNGKATQSNCSQGS